jgi:hypothetical protein
MHGRFVYVLRSVDYPEELATRFEKYLKPAPATLFERDISVDG